MAGDPKDARTQAEQRFDSFQKTKVEAMSKVESDLHAARKKIARLKAERLARDAAEGKTELDKPKPKAKPRKPRAAGRG